VKIDVQSMLESKIVVVGVLLWKESVDVVVRQHVVVKIILQSCGPVNHRAHLRYVFESSY
jgi:hypothetical protein